MDLSLRWSFPDALCSSSALTVLSSVAPRLKYNKPEMVKLFGSVSASYANPDYIASKCSTPIRLQSGGDPDPNNFHKDASGTTCLQIQHAGQSFQNFAQYLAHWTTITGSGGGMKDLRSRPRAPGMLYDNTTVLGSWIDIKDLSETSTTFNRRTHNVTMAMPHSGVFSAARDPINQIIQPQDLGGVGEYKIRASVPSPAVNVVCAGLTRDELRPFVPSMGNRGDNKSTDASEGLKESIVDDLFGFDEANGRSLPTFESAPMIHNTVLNTSVSHLKATKGRPLCSPC